MARRRANGRRGDGRPRYGDRVRTRARELTLATLHRQQLLQRAALPVPDAVRRIFAVQAQEPASPYLALWNRVADLAAEDVDRAFAEGELIKATLLRITLHAVTADDHAALHVAMRASLRRSRLRDRRFLDGGLSEADADAALAHLLTDALHSPRGNAELEALLREAGYGAPPPGLWWALRSYGPVRHAVTGGPWSFGARPAYVAAEPLPDADADSDAAVRHYVRRYLAAFGPATVRDMAQFSLLGRPVLRAAAEAEVAAGTLDRADGADCFDIADAPETPDVEAPPRLLPMWDSVLLAYADRSRIVPDEYRPHVIRRNGDTLATVLVDGRVAGVWQASRDGVEVGAFVPFTARTWRQLQAEAAALHGFLADRDPEVYRRHRRWWDTLPLTESRLLS